MFLFCDAILSIRVRLFLKMESEIPLNKSRREPIFTASDWEVLVTLVENEFEVQGSKLNTDFLSVHDKTVRWKVVFLIANIISTFFHFI